MRALERNLVEEHFTEGEPDLEPPEELAVGELDDEAMLEEELDNEDLLEQDVDEDVLEVTLEDLVHGDDEIDAAAQDTEGGLLGGAAPGHDGDGRPTVNGHGADGARSADGQAGDGGRDRGVDDEDGDDAGDDVEQALDQILRTRLALVDLDGLVDEAEDREFTTLVRVALDADAAIVAPCGPDEFVCRSCFLVRKRVQLADERSGRCHDCSL